MNIISIITAWLAAAWAWFVAHPTIGVPVVGTLVVWATKKRTPEAYAAMAARWPAPIWSRLAALTQLASAVFPDPLKARTAAIKLIFGIVEPLEEQKPAKSKKLDAKAPGTTMLLFLFFGSASITYEACKPPQTPRETARATVILVADAVDKLDKACASVATAKKDKELATKCADAYDAARASLLVAEEGVDAWDRGAAGDVPCAAAKAVGALGKLNDALVAAGGRSPPAVDDALKLAPFVTAGCRAP